jgi:hypothetical protein
MNRHMIFTVASWEPRFLMGFRRIVEKFNPEQVVMYFYSEYVKHSAENCAEVRKICNSGGITLLEYGLSYTDPIASWKVLYNSVLASQIEKQSIVVDITTMPRETIWILFGFFDGAATSVTWTYHKPEGYNTHWLSRDPGRPRLVPKMGGVVSLGVPTKLLITSGFDVERARQLILFYEPEFILMGIQTGRQFNNEIMNVARHIQEFQGGQATKIFEMDAYCPDHGREKIEAEIKGHLQDSNLVMASLGPKPSALALYQIHKAHPQTSLAYAPSQEFNPEYSFGITETMVGTI